MHLSSKYVFYSCTEIKQPNNKVNNRNTSGTFPIYIHENFCLAFLRPSAEFSPPHFRQRNNSSHREDVIAAQQTENSERRRGQKEQLFAGRETLPLARISRKQVYFGIFNLAKFHTGVRNACNPPFPPRQLYLEAKYACTRRAESCCTFIKRADQTSYWKYTGRFVLIPCERDSRESVKCRCTRLLSRVVRLLAISSRLVWELAIQTRFSSRDETIKIRVSLISLAISK